MTAAFPFSAIVGQTDMKRAMILTAIEPGLGGVLVFGDRGTGKSTAVRALAALLPPIRMVGAAPSMPKPSRTAPTGPRPRAPRSAPAPPRSSICRSA